MWSHLLDLIRCMMSTVLVILCDTCLKYRVVTSDNFSSRFCLTLHFFFGIFVCVMYFVLCLCIACVFVCIFYYSEFGLMLYALIAFYDSCSECLPSMLWRCWLCGRKGIQPVKTEWGGGAGMVICLEWGAFLHIAQLMSLPLTVSCFSKVQIVFYLSGTGLLG